MSKNRKLFSGDAKLVNFREICMGSIAPGTLYRSSHPIKDNEQENVIALLANEARIAAVINLSDTDYEISTKAFIAPWYNQLYENNRVIGLDMNIYMAGTVFSSKLKKVVQFINNTESPWLIHCHAGSDRTGFVAIILESLMGATVEEIKTDYLLSNNSLFALGAQKGSDDFMRLIAFLPEMQGESSSDDTNLTLVAEYYLRNTIGLSVDEINLLKAKLSKK